MVYGRYNELVNVGYFMVYKATNKQNWGAHPVQETMVFPSFFGGDFIINLLHHPIQTSLNSSVSICLPGVDLFDHLRFQRRDVHKKQRGML